MSTQIELNERYYRVLHALFDGMTADCLTIVPVRTLKNAGIPTLSRSLIQARLVQCVHIQIINELRPVLPMISDYLEREKLTVIDVDALYDHEVLVPTARQDQRHLYAAVGIDYDALVREQDELADSLRSA